MIVECATCPVQGVRCDGCVVTALAGLPVVPVVTGGPADAAGSDGSDGGLTLDAAERRAVEAFVRAGLIDGGYAGSLRARAEPHTWRRRASG